MASSFPGAAGASGTSAKAPRPGPGRSRVRVRFRGSAERHQQVVETADERGGFLYPRPEGEYRLVEQDVGPFGQVRVGGLVVEPPQQRVLRVDLEHRLAGQAGAAQALGQVDVDLGLVGHDAGRRGGQPAAHPDVEGPAVQGRLQLAGQPGELGAGLLLGRSFCLVLELGQVAAALSDGLQALAVEIAQAGHDPVVDALTLAQEQDLDALLTERLQVRAGLGGGQARRQQVVDVLLALLHPAYVIAERDVRLAGAGLGRGEAQQLGDLVAVPVVLGQAFLQDGAELLPERGVLLRLLLRRVGEQPQHLLGRVGPDVVDDAAALQQFAGDVERQVAGVDHAADEPQVLRHQLTGVLQHEDPPDVQLDTPADLRHPQVEGRARRDEQQQRVLVSPLDLAVHPGQRVGEVAGHVAVEVAVVLLGELALGPGPQRRGLVDRCLLWRLLSGLVLRGLGRHEDGQADVIGVLLDDRAQPEAGQQVVLALAQVQHDRGAAGGLLHRLQGVLAPAV